MTSAHPRGLRIALAALAVLLPITLVGCGSNDVVISVDILSFVDEGAQSGDYAAPPGVVMPPQTIEPQTIVLPEGLAGAVAIERVEMTFTVEFTPEALSGDGSITIQLYFAEADTAQGGASVYDTEPVYTGVADLVGGTQVTHTALIEAAAGDDLLRIFQGGDFLFGLGLGVDSSASVDPVLGQWVIRQIDARLTGKGAVF